MSRKGHYAPRAPDVHPGGAHAARERLLDADGTLRVQALEHAREHASPDCALCTAAATYKLALRDWSQSKERS